MTYLNDLADDEKLGVHVELMGKIWKVKLIGEGSVNIVPVKKKKVKIKGTEFEAEEKSLNVSLEARLKVVPKQ